MARDETGLPLNHDVWEKERQRNVELYGVRYEAICLGHRTETKRPRESIDVPEDEILDGTWTEKHSAHDLWMGETVFKAQPGERGVPSALVGDAEGTRPDLLGGTAGARSSEGCSRSESVREAGPGVDREDAVGGEDFYFDDGTDDDD